MLLSYHLLGEVSRFLIRQQARLVLLQILVLYRDVVQRYDHHGLARLHLLFPFVDLKQLVLD